MPQRQTLKFTSAKFPEDSAQAVSLKFEGQDNLSYLFGYKTGFSPFSNDYK